MIQMKHGLNANSQGGYMKRILALTLILVFLPICVFAAPSSLEELKKVLESSAITGDNASNGTATPSNLQQTIKNLTTALDNMATAGKFNPEQEKKIQTLLDSVTKEITRLSGGSSSGTTNTSGTPETTTTPGTATAPPTSSTPAKGTVNVNTRLNVRDGKWGEITGKLSDGDAVEIIGQDGDWLKIKNADGGTSFIHSRYVNQEGKSDTSFEGTVRTAGDTLNVRSTPGGAIIGSLNPNDKVKVTGRDGDWYKVEINGQTAYVSKNYVGQEGDKFPTETPGSPGNNGTNTAGTDSGATPESGPAVNGFTFPVGRAGCRFSDTWGAPRSGGRRHEGQDIFNAKNTPLVACKPGTIGRMTTSGLGGISIRVLADGVSWYYTHLDHFANNRPGQTVAAGALVGYLGKSGNAASTPPHLHFGAYRNNRAFNPYSLLHASYPSAWGGH